MTTQVIFKVDKKLKDKAMKKAQNEGFPFAVVLKFATKAFVDGDFDLGLVFNEEFNSHTRKTVVKALKESKSGKNISPRFTNIQKAIAHLKS
jgi:hypothetical protein